MAYDYNKAKQAWEMMDDNQKKQYTEQNKNDANFQQFAQQYHNEMNGSWSSSSNGSVNQNNTINNTQWTNTQPTTQSNQNQTNQNGTTYDFSNNHSTLSDWRNWNWNFYGNTQFDREEQFDKSMIGDTKWVTIQEWTGKDTGRPDYQIDTDARLNEMRNNLNQYYQTNPERFQDRETFNRQFEYNQRESDAQRALLDSYWKKAQDMRTVNNYTNWDSVMAGFNSYDITPDQMSLLRQYNPEAYAQWQKQMQDELNARITNLAAPRDVWDTVDLWWEIVKKLWIEAGDPYDIYGTWYNMAEQLWVFRDSQQLASMSNNIASIYATMNSNVQSISSQLEGRYSAGYIEARINKANSRLNSQASSMQYSYNLLLQKRNQNMAIAQQAGAMKQAQWQEDSRVFNNKLNALKFAMTADSYRTPEQQAGLRLQEESIRNDMNLLDQAKKNDLALYNQYATAKLQNQLEAELTNLDVSDPVQQRANLNRVVWQYFEQYWDIIQRSQSQVVDDVLRYAKEHWISVWQALTKNFIEPLQSKQEYQNMIASTYPTPENKYQPHWKQTMDKDGNITWTAEWYWELQNMFANISDRIGVRNSVSTLSDMVSNPVEFMSALQQLYPEGTYWGECWEFCNDILEYWFWDSTHFWSNFQNEKLIHRNKYAYEKPEVWDVYLMSNKKNPNWHMWLIADVSSNWDVTIVDSNGILDDDWKWTHQVRYKTYSASEWEKLCNSWIWNYKVEWYYQSPSVANSNPMTNSFKNAISNVKWATAVERAAVANWKRIYDSFAMMKKNWEMEALIRDSFWKDLFWNLVTQQFSSEKWTWDSFYQALQNTLTNEVTKWSIDNTTKAAILNVARAVEIKLRKESWAAISASEWQSNFFNYMPWQWKWLQADIESLQAWDSLIESWVWNWLNEWQPYQPLFDRSYIFSVQDWYTGTFITDVNNLPASAKKKDSSKWYWYWTDILKNMYAPWLSLLNTIFNK